MTDTRAPAQLYRVTMQSAVGTFIYTDVMADTGDGAAEAGLREHPGAKVTHIEPAPAALQPHIIAAAKTEAAKKAA